MSMDAFRIVGGRPLHGTVRINGSKNASLPLMAATLLTTDKIELVDVPGLSDIGSMARLLEALGEEVSFNEDANGIRTMTSVTKDESCVTAPYELMKTMRAGICTLGPLLAARGSAKVSLPGGCAIGARPVDLHLRGLRALGAHIELSEGYIIANVPPEEGRLIGARIFLGGPNGSTVTGTANVLCAAVLAKGETIIECAACEPEIVNLATMLNAMGAQIEGAGTPRLTIQGVESLTGIRHQVLADRIEAGTYVCAAAATGGNVTIENFPTDCLGAAIDRWELMGIRLESTNLDVSGTFRPGLSDSVRVMVDRVMHATEITTQPHPGFPTDLQAQFMTVLALAEGNSIITEKIYPERFMHVPELTRMGASIVHIGNTAVVSGVRQLHGAQVMASDLRASAGLVIAGMAAQGETNVQRVYHLDRGYQQMEKQLQALGADIERYKSDI